MQCPKRKIPRLLTIIRETNGVFFALLKAQKAMVWETVLSFIQSQPKHFTQPAVCFWLCVILCSLGIPSHSHSNRWCIQQAPSGSRVHHQEPHQLMWYRRANANSFMSYNYLDHCLIVWILLNLLA